MDRAGGPVDFQPGAIGDGCDAGNAHHGGDPQLPGDDGGMALHCSGIADDCRGDEEERCPAGVSDRADENLAWLQSSWVAWIGDHPGRSGSDSATDGDAAQFGSRRRRDAGRAGFKP